VISSSPFPQRDVGSNFIAPEMMTYNRGKGAKGKKQRPSLNFVLLILLLKFLSFSLSLDLKEKSIQKLYQNKHS
jgi:hypothetical protein